MPVAGCQVSPPSVDTSTPATRPPTSVAVPLTVTSDPLATEVAGAGEVIVALGAVVSVDAVGRTSPLISVAGCTPMSAKRLTVACCIRGSAGSCGPSCSESRPQAHWIVPAPKTSAPLAARYRVRWWVVVPGVVTVPKSRRYSGWARWWWTGG